MKRKAETQEWLETPCETQPRNAENRGGPKCTMKHIEIQNYQTHHELVVVVVVVMVVFSMKSVHRGRSQLGIHMNVHTCIH